MMWHILGAGAMGCLWAARLHQAGLPVTLIRREPAASPVTLQIERDQHLEQLHLPATSASHGAPIAHLLITTKAYDTLSAVASVAHRLTPTTEIVLLQNGMGPQQQLAQAYPHQPIWAATTTAAAWCRAPLHLVPVSEGDTHAGPLTANAPPLPSGWTHLHPSIQATQEIHTLLWRKLAINCAINPLTALYRCRNGDLLTHPDAHTTMKQICAEVETVAHAANISLFETSLYERACAVAHATADNFSSMHQDITLGRRSEIEQITGYLCAEAQRLGIHTPVNLSLFNALRHTAQTG